MQKSNLITNIFYNLIVYGSFYIIIIYKLMFKNKWNVKLQYKKLTMPLQKNLV